MKWLGYDSVEVRSCYMDYRCEIAGVPQLRWGLAIWTTVVKWLGFTMTVLR